MAERRYAIDQRWTTPVRAYWRSRSSKKHLGHAAEQDVPHRLEMCAARLDLLGERVHVAEAPLERAAREDGVDAGFLVGEVGDIGRGMDRIGAGKPHAGALGEADRLRLARLRVDRGERLDQIGARR